MPLVERLKDIDWNGKRDTKSRNRAGLRVDSFKPFFWDRQLWYDLFQYEEIQRADGSISRRKHTRLR
jgi:hypothetical protein